jgi:hypothetical protein
MVNYTKFVKATEEIAEAGKKLDTRFSEKLGPVVKVDVPEGEELQKNLTKGMTPDLIARTAKTDPTMTKEYVSALRRSAGEAAEGRKTVKDVWSKLTSEEQEQLNELYQQGQQAYGGMGKTFTDDELNLMQISPNVKEAMKDWYSIADAEYQETNRRLVKAMEREGYKGSETGMVTKEVKPDVLNTSSFGSMEIRVPDQRKTLNSSNSSATDIMNKYINNGYTLREVHNYTRINDELPYSHVLVKNNDSFEKDLPQYVLNYAEGGPRRYQQGEWFVKTGRTIYGETNKAYFDPQGKTLIAGEDPKELQKYADDVNTIRNIWLNNRGDLQKMQQAVDRTQFKWMKNITASDIQDLVRTADNPHGEIDVNFEAGVYRDGEYPINNTTLPTMYSAGGDLDSSALQLSQLNSRYYRGRGKILKNVNEGSFDHLMNVADVMQNTVEQLAYSRNIMEAADEYGEVFKQQFGKVIDTSNGINPANTSGAWLLVNGDIIDDSKLNKADRKIAQAARRMQQITRNLMNTPSSIDRKIQTYFNNIYDMVGADFLHDKNPLTLAKSTAVEMALGLFNLSQLWKQPMQVVNIATMHPLETAKAVAGSPFLFLLHGGNGDGIANAFYRGCLKGLGYTDKDIDGLLHFMKQYGTFAQISQRTEMVGTNMFLKGMSKFKKGSMVFFNIGQNYAYLIGDMTAWQLSETKDFKDIARIADNLNFNMSAVHSNKLQKNPFTSFGTLLGTYSIATMGAILGKSLPPADRAKLLLGLVAMWGVGGTGGEDLKPWMYNTFGDGAEQRLIIEGLFTVLAADEEGIDLRQGPDVTGSVVPFVQTIMGLIKSGEDMPDVPTTAVLPNFTGVYKTLKAFFAPTVSDRDVVLGIKAAARWAASNIMPGGIKNIGSSIWAFLARQELDSRGRVVDDNVDYKHALYLLMGLRSSKSHDLNSARARDMEYKEFTNSLYDNYVSEALNKYKAYSDTSEWSQVESDIMYQDVRNGVAQAVAIMRKGIKHGEGLYEQQFRTKVYNGIMDNRTAEHKMTDTQKAQMITKEEAEELLKKLGLELKEAE